MERINPQIYQLADDALLELIEKAKVSALTEAEYAQYEAEMKILSNRGTVERYGFDQGMKRGLEEGRIAGELSERMKNIASLKAYGLTNEQIAQALQIPIEEVK